MLKLQLINAKTSEVANMRFTSLKKLFFSQ